MVWPLKLISNTSVCGCCADACSFNSLCIATGQEKSETTRQELLTLISRLLVNRQYDWPHHSNVTAVTCSLPVTTTRRTCLHGNETRSVCIEDVWNSSGSGGWLIWPGLPRLADFGRNWSGCCRLWAALCRCGQRVGGFRLSPRFVCQWGHSSSWQVAFTQRLTQPQSKGKGHSVPCSTYRALKEPHVGGKGRMKTGCWLGEGKRGVGVKVGVRWIISRPGLKLVKIRSTKALHRRPSCYLGQDDIIEKFRFSWVGLGSLRVFVNACDCCCKITYT